MNRTCVLFALAAALLLSACHADVDLKNIDKKAEIKMALALPIGHMSATLGDFLGDGQVNKIVVDEYKVFHYLDTVDLPTKLYHPIDLSQYQLTHTEDVVLDLADAEGYGDAPTDGNRTYDLAVDFDLQLEGINNDTTDERIDSVILTSFHFYTTIRQENMQLPWRSIESVQLELGEQFWRAEGNMLDIPLQGKDFDRELKLDVEEKTHLCLMVDKNKPGKTINTIPLRIHFRITVPESESVNNDSRLICSNMRLEVEDFEAMWGFFEASNQMSDEDHICIEEQWPEWRNIKRLKVRFAEPVIDVRISHKVAAPLMMYVDYVTAKDSAGHNQYASWDNGSGPRRDTHFELEPTLSPHPSTLGDSVFNQRRLSYKPEQGHIDQLFDVRPDSFSYSFYMKADRNKRPDYHWNQHRITPDTRVIGKAYSDLPFKLNEESEAQYVTTFSDVSLSSVNLDSLRASVALLDTVKTSNLKLFLHFYNTIPFNLEATVAFLDKDSADLHLQLVQDNDKNRVYLPVPEMARKGGNKYGEVIKPGEELLIIDVDKNDFDRLSQTKYIRLDASIYGNPVPCQITTETMLRVHIGITADVDAILQLDELFNQQENQK